MLRLALACLFLCATLSTATADVTAWSGSVNHRLNETATKLPNGTPTARLRCRASAGDLVWVTLRGLLDPDSGTSAPLPAVLLEYDPSGGKGEWELAEMGDNAMGVEIPAPAHGVLEFRVRAKTPAGTSEPFSLHFGADVRAAKPQFFLSGDVQSSIAPGYEKVYPLNAPRGNSTYEFELWAEGFEPALKLTDPKGHELGRILIEQAPKYLALRYVAPAEGKYRLTVKAGDRRGGDFVLRTWYPLKVGQGK
jgi:hypothetical protein